MNYKVDTDERVCFYEQEFYVLSNFSAFTLIWKGLRFDTSEAAYHWEKFPMHSLIKKQIQEAPSAHEAFKIAEQNKQFRRPDWDEIKVPTMKQLLFHKANQHEYVMRKLLETGNRELVEDSWRDNFWGWGPNKDGKNMLGRLWMEVRESIRNGKTTNYKDERWMFEDVMFQKPFAPYYDKYKGEIFVIDHFMPEDECGDHVWVFCVSNSSIKIDRYVHFDDLKKVQ